MPIEKMLNVLKILFAALSAMFLILYVSLMQRQNAITVEAATRKVRDVDSLFNSVPLSPAMALIPMVVCIIFTIFLFVIGAKEKKKLEQKQTQDTEIASDESDQNALIGENTDNNADNAPIQENNATASQNPDTTEEKDEI